MSVRLDFLSAGRDFVHDAVREYRNYLIGIRSQRLTAMSDAGVDPTLAQEIQVAEFCDERLQDPGPVTLTDETAILVKTAYLYALESKERRLQSLRHQGATQGELASHEERVEDIRKTLAWKGYMKVPEKRPLDLTPLAQAGGEDSSRAHLAGDNGGDSAEASRRLMELLELYRLPPDATRAFAGVSHDALVDAMNLFLFHHGPVIGIRGWSDNIQGLRDGGIDSVWNYRLSQAPDSFGIQIKSHGDFENGKADSFRRTVMAQIAESHQRRLSRLLLGLCADLTSESQKEKARGVLGDVGRMTDDYVVALSPEKMVGVWKWSQGLQQEPLIQMREAGYAWLTAAFDSLGNINHNSWGKGTGGGWSHVVRTTIRVGDTLSLSAIAISPDESPIEYRFSVARSGQGFEIRQNWSRAADWRWTIAEREIGRHVVVSIAVRRPKSYYQFNDCDDYTYATYDVLPAQSTVSETPRGLQA